MIKLFFKIIKKDGSDKFQDWKPADIFISLLMLIPKILRGFYFKLFLKKSNGLIIVGKGIKIFNCKYITSGKNLNIDDYVEISGLSKIGINFGDNVSIGKYAIIRPTNQYGSEIGEGLIVGHNSNIGSFAYIGCSGKIEIGNNVLMGPRVSIYSEKHNFDDNSKPIRDQGVTKTFVKIEDDCWIGSNSVILPNVTIHKGSVVAAGSIVTKDVPPFSIVGGNPAQLIKRRD